MRVHCILAKVRFAYYFKFGGAVKCVSSLLSKFFSVIVGVTVKKRSENNITLERFV